MLFCPRLYFCTARRTWSDPSVFQSLPGTIQSWQHTVSRLVGANLRKRYYAWGIRSSSPLPSGLTLLKRKKSFQVARTIISYKNSIIERLLKAAAQVLHMMIATVWPHALGLLSLPQVWQQLHSFLETTDVTVHLCEANDDLVGFFNLESLQCLTADFLRQRGDQVLAVDLNAKPNHEKAFIGRHRTGTSRNLKHVFMNDLESIAQASFDTGIFWACGAVRCQIDGTSIGNQISPVLSSLPVCRTEMAWLASWTAQLRDSSNFLPVRGQ